jgi:hypothetical protein
MGLDVVRRHSDAAVGRDEECGSLTGKHRVAHVRSIAVRAEHVDAAKAREELLRVAARDREADALVGDAPGARRRRAWVEAQRYDTSCSIEPGQPAREFSYICDT